MSAHVYKDEKKEEFICGAKSAKYLVSVFDNEVNSKHPMMEKCCKTCMRGLGERNVVDYVPTTEHAGRMFGIQPSP